MITKSETSSIEPVEGVYVLFNYVDSPISSADGTFTVQLPKRFSLNGVGPDSKYILANGIKGNYEVTNNNLLVIIASKDQVKKESALIYQKNKAALDKAIKERNAFKTECVKLRSKLQENSAEYQMLSLKIDSIDKLNEQYLAQIKNLKEEAEKLALTDYMSLGEIEKKAYDLKVEGNDPHLIDFLLRRVMRNNPSSYLNNNHFGMNLYKELIEAEKRTFQYDSVSSRYNELISLYPKDWDILNEAAIFECNQKRNFNKGIQLWEKSVNLPVADTLKAQSILYISQAYGAKGYYDQSREKANQVLTLLSHFPEENEYIAKAFVQIGHTYGMKERDFNTQVKYLNKAKDVTIKVHGKNSISYINMLQNLSLPLNSMNKFNEALELLFEAEKIAININYDKSSIYENIGITYYNMCRLNMSDIKEYDRIANLSKIYFEKAITEALKYNSEDDMSMGQFYTNLAILCNKLNKPEVSVALENLQKAEDIYKKYYGETCVELAEIYEAQGIAHALKGNQEKAYECYDNSIKIISDFYGNTHQKTKSQIFEIAKIMYQMGKWQDCRYRLSRWPEERISFEDAMRFILLGEACVQSELYGGALTNYKKALNIFKELKKLNYGYDLDPYIQECKTFIKVLK